MSIVQSMMTMASIPKSKNKLRYLFFIVGNRLLISQITIDIPQCLSQYRVYHIGRNLRQRLHHKAAFLHQRMGKFQDRGVKNKISVNQQINIYHTIFLLSVHRFMGTPHLLFNGLGYGKYLQRRK